MTGVSWRPGCPVALRDLRLLTVSYWNFAGQRRTGRLVVLDTAASPLRGVFRRLYVARFPIRRMVPVDAFGGSDFRSIEAWRSDLKATGMAARGWAWTAYDWDEGRLFNYLGDAQNTFPVWNATPLVALDVYEHAYFLDYQTDRASYIDAFFANLDWGIVNDWVGRYGIPTR